MKYKRESLINYTEFEFNDHPFYSCSYSLDIDSSNNQIPKPIGEGYKPLDYFENIRKQESLEKKWSDVDMQEYVGFYNQKAKSGNYNAQEIMNQFKKMKNKKQ